MRVGMLHAAAIGLAAAAAGTGAGRAQERQLGAHEHGRGTLDIALDGARLGLQLEAPGMDIVGFEHAASTDKQKTAVEAAKKRLAAPQALFELPAAAGCVLKEAKVAVEPEDHDQGHGPGAAQGADGRGDSEKERGAKAEHAGHEHSAFRAEYAFDCSAPASLTTIGFGYFKAFAGAQKLDVTVVMPKGQNRFEVSRAKPRLDLGGMM
jgi:hypothetical protein